MRILTATKHGQGLRKTDVSEANEGEWLFLPVNGKKLDHLVGVVTLKPTTTFRVSDLPITPNEYFDKIGLANKKQNNADLTCDHDLIRIGLEGQELLRLANEFPDNVILEMKRGRICVRKFLPVYVYKDKTVE